MCEILHTRTRAKCVRCLCRCRKQSTQTRNVKIDRFGYQKGSKFKAVIYSLKLPYISPLCTPMCNPRGVQKFSTTPQNIKLHFWIPQLGPGSQQECLNTLFEDIRLLATIAVVKFSVHKMSNLIGMQNQYLYCNKVIVQGTSHNI